MAWSTQAFIKTTLACFFFLLEFPPSVCVCTHTATYMHMCVQTSATAQHGGQRITCESGSLCSLCGFCTSNLGYQTLQDHLHLLNHLPSPCCCFSMLPSLAWNLLCRQASLKLGQHGWLSLVNAGFLRCELPPHSASFSTHLFFDMGLSASQIGWSQNHGLRMPGTVTKMKVSPLFWDSQRQNFNLHTDSSCTGLVRKTKQSIHSRETLEQADPKWDKQQLNSALWICLTVCLGTICMQAALRD